MWVSALNFVGDRVRRKAVKSLLLAGPNQRRPFICAAQQVDVCICFYTIVLLLLFLSTKAHFVSGKSVGQAKYIRNAIN